MQLKTWDKNCKILLTRRYLRRTLLIAKRTGLKRLQVNCNKTINKIFKYSKYLKRLNIVCKKS